MRTFEVLLVSLLWSFCNGWFFRPTSTWDGLRVTWGVNPFSSWNFAALPRTEADARAAGWVKFSDCTANPLFLGKRYVKDDDYAVALLYDVNGFIAGIQTAFDQSVADITVRNSRQAAYNVEGNRYVITAYFVDPSIICTTGRSSMEETGTGLYMQNGTDPIRDSITFPKDESAITTTGFVGGKCFPFMGDHYWWNLQENMDCRMFFPGFVLYNSGKLNAFGFAFPANAVSNRFEHPSTTGLSMFLDPKPTCLDTVGTLTTMHIYLTDSPRSNNC